MKRKKKKYFKEFILTSIFTLFFVICLTPVKQSNANPLLAAIIKAVASDATTSAVVAEKFDLFKSMLENNGFSMEGMSKQDIYDTAKASEYADNVFDKFNVETEPVKSDDWGVNFMNDLFGNDDLVFFKDANGTYDFISKPGEDGFGFNDIATEFLANTITDTMESILHPIDSAINTASNKINETLHPIETLEKQFDFLDGQSNFLDKFDTDKYASKDDSEEEMSASSLENDAMDGMMAELQRDMMEEKLDLALDGLFEQLYYTDNDLENAIDGVFQQLYDQQELENTLNSLGDQQEQMIFDASSMNNLHP